MSLANVGRGKRISPRRICLYGVQGIGKSTFGSMAPRPIFVPTEEGTNDIDCDAFFKDRKEKPICQSYAEVVDCLTQLYREPHEYLTCVIDTLDWLERLIWDKTCEAYGVNSIEKVDKGYGKGYIHCLTYWRELLSGLDALRSDRGMNIVLLAHAKIERFDNPETEPYDRYSPRLNKHAAYLVQEWCDEVLFANRKVFTTTSDEGKTRAMSGLGNDERIIRTTERPAHLAKNRLNMPFEIPLDWREYAKYLPGATAA